MIEAIKNLRASTGAGILDCKKALQESGQNTEKAMEWLKKRGLAKAAKKAGRSAKQGVVSSYLHGEGRIGVLVEVNTETDFAARSQQFKTFVHHLGLHIAAMSPLFICQEDIPADLWEKEKAIFMEQAQREGKKSSVLDKVVQGRLLKWTEEICLLKQTFLVSTQSDKPLSVELALKSAAAELGENVVIRRFVRFELGEQSEPLSDSADKSAADKSVADKSAADKSAT